VHPHPGPSGAGHPPVRPAAPAAGESAPGAAGSPIPGTRAPGPSPLAGSNAIDPADTVDGIDAIEMALESLADLPQSRHVAVFTDIHQRLTAALALTGGVQQTQQTQPAPAGNRPGPPNQQRGR